MQQSLWAGSRNDPVSRTALPGSDRAKTMTATSGQKCVESFEKFSRPGLLAKTFPALLIGQAGWYSKKCNLIWKLKATKYNRLYFQLQVSVPRTEGIESGLWPTPTTQEPVSKCEITAGGRRMTKDGKDSRGLNIGRMAAMGLFPTPTAQDFKRRGPNSKQQGLPEAAHSGMLPTPTADDCPSKNTGKRNQDGLQKRAFQTTGKTSQLNHRFVMEMMGFPPDWCDIYYELAEIAIQKKRQKKKPKG